MYTVRKTTRNVDGTLKGFKVYTFTGTPEQYDLFRDLRTDADGQMRRDGKMVDVGGCLEPASFEVRFDA